MKSEQNQAQQIETLRKAVLIKKNACERLVMLTVDPMQASQKLFNFFLAIVELEQDDSYFANYSIGDNPKLYIEALKRTENWYTERNLQYPYPDRLKEMIEYWENKQQS